MHFWSEWKDKINKHELIKIKGSGGYEITTLSQGSGGNESTDGSMQLLASPWQAAERLIPQPPCPAAGSIAPSDLLPLPHKYTRCQRINIKWSRDGEPGDCMETKLFFTLPFTFLSSEPSSICARFFYPLNSYQRPLSCLLHSSHLFQLQLSGWREWNSVLVFIKEPLERTSLWHCNRNTGFRT